MKTEETEKAEANEFLNLLNTTATAQKNRREQIALKIYCYSEITFKRAFESADEFIKYSDETFKEKY